MIKTSQCSHCAKIFSYNDNDSKGLFCTRSCHYKSKKHMAICKNCGKDFIKNKREMRQTCSEKCYLLRRSLRSKSEQIRETARIKNSENAGQICIDKKINEDIPPALTDLPMVEWEKYVAPEFLKRFPFAALLNSFKSLVKKIFIKKGD